MGSNGKADIFGLLRSSNSAVRDQKELYGQLIVTGAVGKFTTTSANAPWCVQHEMMLFFREDVQRRILTETWSKPEENHLQLSYVTATHPLVLNTLWKAFEAAQMNIAEGRQVQRETQQPAIIIPLFQHAG